MSRGEIKVKELGGASAHAPNRLMHNIPYILAILVGSVLILFSIGPSFLGWVLAGSYLLYALLSTLWFIVLLCGHCNSYGSGNCPSGFGRLAAMLRKKGQGGNFTIRFRVHMPVVVPIWIIPVVIALIDLFHGYSIGTILLLTVFVFNSFVLLPLFSRKKGCSGCSQRRDCPFKGKERK